MLTKFEAYDTMKKKFTVIMIWIVGIAILAGLVRFLEKSDLSLGILGLIGFLVAFAVLAILLRCKVGRWFTLLGIYTFMLTPIMNAVLPIFLLPNEKIVPVDSEQALIHLVLGGLAVYFLSNKESMDIYFIRPNPKEHIIFAFLATIIIGGYIYITKISI